MVSASFQNYKQHGNEAFQNQRYDDAISFYTQALDVASAEERVIALSNRAAAYAKAEHWSLSEQDAIQCLTASEVPHLKATLHLQRALVKRKAYGRAQVLVESGLLYHENDKELLKCKKEIDTWCRRYGPTLDDIDIKEELGTGNFTMIFRGIVKRKRKVDQATGEVQVEEGEQQVAVKVIDRARVKHLKKENDVRMEKHILAKLWHPSIVEFYSTFSDELNHYLLLELCTEGELWHLVRGVGLFLNSAHYYLHQVLDALEYLHQEHILHRDLKAENVMIKNGRVKLIDFGTAKDLKNLKVTPPGNVCQRKTFVNYVGTPHFMPPEVIKNRNTDTRSDMFSMGSFIYQILAGAPPFQAGSEFLIFIRVINKDIIWPPFFPEKARVLIEKLHDHEPELRPTLAQVKEDPFWEASSWAEVQARKQPVMPLLWHCLKKMQRLEDDKYMPLPELAEDTDETLKLWYERLKAVRQWDFESRPGHGPTPRLEEMMQKELAKNDGTKIPFAPEKKKKRQRRRRRGRGPSSSRQSQ